MGFSSVKNLVAAVAETTPGQFDDWRKAWRAAADNGSTEPLLSFVARERGLAEDVFLQRLADALDWPFVDLHKHTIPPEARNKLSTKVAFQYFVLPTAVNDDALQVVVSDPFDAAMMNAVRFDAQMPGAIRAGAKNGNRKGAQKILRRRRRNAGRTGRERADGTGNRHRQGNHRGRPGGQRHQIRQPDHLGGVTRTARRTFISNRRRTNCAFATALTAFCIRRRCRRNSNGFRRRSSRASR